MNTNKIILIGMKGCGKTTVGKLLADKLKIRFIELDEKLEKEHQRLKKERLTFREIFKKYGDKYFRQLETDTLDSLAKTLDKTDFVFACGGGTPLMKENQTILRGMGKIVYLKVDRDILLQRIVKDGIPAFFPNSVNPKRFLEGILKKREPIYEKMADITINCFNNKAKTIMEDITKRV